MTMDWTTGEIGSVYLLHFDVPFGHAKHYTGWARSLDARLAHHANGQGARLTEVVRAAGIGWSLARTWPAARADRGAGGRMRGEIVRNEQTIYDIQTKALWAQEEKRSALRQALTETLRLGAGAHITEIVTLPAGGHVVGVQGVIEPGQVLWTTVYGGRTHGSYYPSDELAMIALLARRQDDDPNATRYAVRYAARMLGVREDGS
jgi:hypothetical protein